MDPNVIWKAALLIFSGFVLLRLSGRKSLSQMTVATTVIMISIGTTIVQPIGNENVWNAILAAALFIVFLVITEWLIVRFNGLERVLTGMAVPVIQDGLVIEKNLRKIRLTVDQLEIRLRAKGIANMSDVKTATIESNGQIGYELKAYAKPLTVGQFEQVMKQMGWNGPPLEAQPSPLFDEVTLKEHQKEIPSMLQ